MLGPIIFTLGVTMLAFVLIRELRRVVRISQRGPVDSQGPWRGPKPYAIDGDTLAVGGERIRILGLDAPEIGQMTLDGAVDAGRAARQVCANLLASGVVTIERRGFDVYGRTLAIVRIGGEDIALLLIRAGYAIAGRDASWTFHRAERGARRRRAGLWERGFADPSSYRASVPSAAPQRRRA